MKVLVIGGGLAGSEAALQIAKRSFDPLRFGPLTPKGFSQEYYAVVQLKREDKDGNLFELVGFQTALTYQGQKRIFSLIPGFENAEFVRYGSIHKNAHFRSNRILNLDLSSKQFPNVFLQVKLQEVKVMRGNFNRSCKWN